MNTAFDCINYNKILLNQLLRSILPVYEKNTKKKQNKKQKTTDLPIQTQQADSVTFIYAGISVRYLRHNPSYDFLHLQAKRLKNLYSIFQNTTVVKSIPYITKQLKIIPFVATYEGLPGVLGNKRTWPI